MSEMKENRTLSPKDIERIQNIRSYLLFSLPTEFPSLPNHYERQLSNVLEAHTLLCGLVRDLLLREL